MMEDNKKDSIAQLADYTQKTSTNLKFKEIDINFFAPWEGLKEVTGILDKHSTEAITIRKIIKGKEFKKQDVLDRKLIANIRPHLDF